MIKINNYKLPSKWEEFTQDEFLMISNLIGHFTAGAYTVDQTKIHLFCKLTDYRIERLKPNLRKKFTANLLTTLKDFNFFYEYKYAPADKFNNISVEVRELLRKNQPQDVSATEAKFAAKLKRSCIPDLVIRKQLIPELRVRRKESLKGYIFDCTKTFNTDLTAEQFIDANKAYELFEETRDFAYVDLLTAILYCKPYNTDKARELVSDIETISVDVKSAILLNYLGVLNFLFNQTTYSILFAPGSKSKAKKKNQLGMTAVLFSMCEKGYGSLSEVSGLNLFTFFDLIYKNISDSITECSANEMSKEDISEKLDISMELINQII